MLFSNCVLDYCSDNAEVYRERVLWLDSDNVIIMPLLKNKWPTVKKREDIEDAIEEGTIRIVPVINELALVVEEDIPPKSIEKRKNCMKFIDKIMAPENIPRIFLDTEFRGRLVRENIGPHNPIRFKSTAYSALRKYWEGGLIANALLPDYRNNTGPKQATDPGSPKRGRPRKATEVTGESYGVNVTEKIARQLIKGARLFFSGDTNFQDAYNATILKFFSVDDGQGNPVAPPDDQRPSVDQFRYWYHKRMDVKKGWIDRKGLNDFNLRRRQVLGNATQKSFGPGARFEVDATIADTPVVSRINRAIVIGRPVIYSIIDVFSHMIAGVYAGFEGPSWLGAMMALYNAGTSKVDFCERYGIKIMYEHWPCEYLPQLLVCDRGEFEGYGPDNLIKTLGVDVQVLPPYRADWKAIVERTFGILHGKYTPWTPGTVVKDYYAQRGNPDSRIDAVLDIEDFTKILIRCVLEHNNEFRLNYYKRNEKMIVDEIEPYPIDLWNWGIKNSSGALRTVPKDQLLFSLMPTGKATITERGIKFQGNHYSCQIAEEEGWFIKARESGRKPLTISYDPRSMDALYFSHKCQEKIEDKIWNIKKVVRCDLLEKDARFKNKTLEEIQIIEFMEAVSLSQAKHKCVEPVVDRIAYIEGVTYEATQKTLKDIERYGIVGRKRLIDSKTWRNIDKAYERVGNVFRIGQSQFRNSQLNSVATVSASRSLEVPEYTDDD